MNPHATHSPGIDSTFHTIQAEAKDSCRQNGLARPSSQDSSICSDIVGLYLTASRYLHGPDHCSNSSVAGSSLAPATPRRSPTEAGAHTEQLQCCSLAKEYATPGRVDDKRTQGNGPSPQPRASMAGTSQSSATPLMAGHALWSTLNTLSIAASRSPTTINTAHAKVSAHASAGANLVNNQSHWSASTVSKASQPHTLQRLHQNSVERVTAAQSRAQSLWRLAIRKALTSLKQRTTNSLSTSISSSSIAFRSASYQHRRVSSRSYGELPAPPEIPALHEAAIWFALDRQTQLPVKAFRIRGPVSTEKFHRIAARCPIPREDVAWYRALGISPDLPEQELVKLTQELYKQCTHEAFLRFPEHWRAQCHRPGSLTDSASVYSEDDDLKPVPLESYIPDFISPGFPGVGLVLQRLGTAETLTCVIRARSGPRGQVTLRQSIAPVSQSAVSDHVDNDESGGSSAGERPFTRHASAMPRRRPHVRPNSRLSSDKFAASDSTEERHDTVQSFSSGTHSTISKPHAACASLVACSDSTTLPPTPVVPSTALFLDNSVSKSHSSHHRRVRLDYTSLEEWERKGLLALRRGAKAADFSSAAPVPAVTLAAAMSATPEQLQHGWFENPRRAPPAPRRNSFEQVVRKCS